MNKVNNSDQFQIIIESNQFNVDYNVLKALNTEGLRKEDYIEICMRLKRGPNRTELGMFGVMWSEHCCYRNSKPLLQNFPTTGKHILVGPGENAGVVDLGQGQRLAFKIESHNHPSAVEPFQGAATGVGGILRDIFTMGARPIALLNSLRFGPLEEKLNIGLLEGVVSGISHYGNCVGVPTVGGEISFHESYSGNPLVNAMAMGLMETDEIVCSGASGINYPVIYVGSTTGRDGMGGASFASAELSNSSLDDRPAVQVGDPFLEKGLIEGCLEAFKTGDVIAAQDMGAAGLTCSCAEMAAKGKVGIELDLNKVPAREDGMTPYEFLLSESQERMLFVVKPDAQLNIMNIFTKWGLRAAVVGKVLNQNIVRVLYNGEIVVNLPANALADDTPINKHNLINQVPEEIKKHWNWNQNSLPIPTIDGVIISNLKEDKLISWNEIIYKLLDDPSIASKKWIYNQYDYQVQNNTIIPPGKGDACVVRLRPVIDDKTNINFNRGIAAVVDCPNRLVSLDPERGSIAAVAEAARNLSCVGAKPLAVTNNLNFSSPENDIGYWKLAMACKGISTACKIFETPVTGGNVSLYNETRLKNGEIQPINPTPVIGMVGIIEDIENVVDQKWKNDQDSVWILGLKDWNKFDHQISLGASAYLEVIHGHITGRPPELDLPFENRILSFLQDSIASNLIESAHDVSEGGIAVSLAESSISSGLGIKCNFSRNDTRIDNLLFGEGSCLVIVSICADKLTEWENKLNIVNTHNNDQIPALEIGKVKDNKQFIITYDEMDLINLSIDEITSSFEDSIPRRINYKDRFNP